MRYRAGNLPIRRMRWRGWRSDAFPGAGGDGVAAFVVFDVVDEGFDGFAVEGGGVDAFGEDGGAFVAPAEFEDEAVPDVAFFVGAGGAEGVGLGEDLLVGATGEGEGVDAGVGDAEEAAAASVEGVELGVAEIGDVVGGELAGGVEADLIEHAGEVDEAACLHVGAAEVGDVGHGIFFSDE